MLPGYFPLNDFVAGGLQNVAIGRLRPTVFDNQDEFLARIRRIVQIGLGRV